MEFSLIQTLTTTRLICFNFQGWGYQQSSAIAAGGAPNTVVNDEIIIWTSNGTDLSTGLNKMAECPALLQ